MRVSWPQAAPHPTQPLHAVLRSWQGNRPSRGRDLCGRGGHPCAPENTTPAGPEPGLASWAGPRDALWTLESHARNRAPSSAPNLLRPRAQDGLLDGWMDRATRKGAPGTQPGAGRELISRPAPAPPPEVAARRARPSAGAAPEPAVGRGPQASSPRLRHASRAPGLRESGDALLRAGRRPRRLRDREAPGSAQHGVWPSRPAGRGPISRRADARSLGTGRWSPAIHPVVAEIQRWRGGFTTECVDGPHSRPPTSARRD